MSGTVRSKQEQTWDKREDNIERHSITCVAQIGLNYILTSRWVSLRKGV